jgi:8-oxo-dGTP pyrophosphatase MutT (NUDIX family)
MPISEYLKKLREKVGHDLVVLPAVSVSIVDNKCRLLLGKDAETNYWALPGGAVDPHERPADAAVRECLEETGLLVELSGLSVSSTARNSWPTTPMAMKPTASRPPFELSLSADRMEAVTASLMSSTISVSPNAKA